MAGHHDQISCTSLRRRQDRLMGQGIDTALNGGIDAGGCRLGPGGSQNLFPLLVAGAHQQLHGVGVQLLAKTAQ